MSQQPHDMGYLDYTIPPNRSPNSSRQAYGGPSIFATGLSLPRQTQRPPFDAPLGSSALYLTERMGAGFNPRAMDGMPAPGAMPGAMHAAMPGGYMLDNSQMWNYAAAGVATVNGAIHGPNRQRSVNRRAAIPQVRLCLMPPRVFGPGRVDSRPRGRPR